MKTAASHFVGPTITSVALLLAAGLGQGCGGTGADALGRNSGNGQGAGAGGGDNGGGGFVAVGSGGTNVASFDASVPIADANSGSMCASATYAGEQAPLDIYIMMDQSLSMVGPKWNGVKTALTNFVNDPSTAGIGFGIQYFGQGLLGTSCTESDYLTPDVPIQPLPGVASAIVSSLNSHNPVTPTPTFPALQGALDYATMWAQMNPDHKVVVVLATDGQPSLCDTNIGDIANLAVGPAMATPAIRTYTVGFQDPASGSLANLDQIAMAGNGQAFTVDGAGADPGADFLKAMNDIRGAALSCDLFIPVPMGTGMVDFNKVNVQYTPPGGTTTFIGYANDVSMCDPMAGGWYYDVPANPTRIELCPATCDQAKGSIGATVNIELGCEQVKVHPK